MSTSIRLAHCRFLNGMPSKKKDIFDRVVTTVWSFDPDTSVLTYASTVFKKVDLEKLNIENTSKITEAKTENQDKNDHSSNQEKDSGDSQSPSDLNFWNKRKHKETALARFHSSPLRIKLVGQNLPELNSPAVDWFIATHLVYEYGTHNKVVPDVRRIHHDREINLNFNWHYDPFYKNHREKFVLGGPKKVCKSSNYSLPFFTLSILTVSVLISLVNYTFFY